MAIFDLKTVIDPLATEVRAFSVTLLDRLDNLAEAQRTTNQLLAGLLEAQVALADRLSPPTAAALPISKSPSRGRAVKA